jgi:Sulfotransferase family
MKPSSSNPNAMLSLTAPSIFPRDFWLVKTKKTGGSTLKGILNGLCAHHAMTCMTMLVNEETGKTYGYWEADHGPAQIAKYRQLGFEHLAITDHGKYSSALAAELRDPLLFTAVRDPVSRVISHFFFVYREGGEPALKEPKLVVKIIKKLRQAVGAIVAGDLDAAKNLIFQSNDAL